MATKITTLANVLALIVLSACGSGMQPTPTTMRIEPEVAAMAIGETTTFRADVGGRALSDATVKWSVAGGSATLSGSTLSATTPGQVTLSATSSSGASVSATIDVVPNVAGTWTGTMHQPTCIRVSGSGPTYCGKSADGWNHGLSMTITQTGTTLTFTEISSDKSVTGGGLAGRIGPDGTMTVPDAVLVFPETPTDVSTLTHWTAVYRDDGHTTLSGTALLDEQWAGPLPQHYSNQNSFVLTRK